LAARRRGGYLESDNFTTSVRSVTVSGARRIIVGASGSPGSLQALRFAADLARDDDAALIPVLAWLPPGGNQADRRQPSAYLRQVWKEAAWQRLWDALDLAWGGLPTDLRAAPTVLRGEAGEVLVDAACRTRDLLVVGAGRRGALRRMIGSRVSRYCLAHAHCPVVAVPPADLAREAHRLGGGLFSRRSLTPGRVALPPTG
jgi:nucleotide-binding universal stress UspA family protein